MHVERRVFILITMWKGRFDGDDPLYQRLFQRVQESSDFSSIAQGDFVLHGFAVDEGVRRNRGRVGAKDAPNIIRKNMANFPIVNPNFVLHDLGNIDCQDENLEVAQSKLTSSVSSVLVKGGKSVVLGGGHEVTFAHFSAIRNAFPNKNIGIINIDAHFDNREVDQKTGASSGTGFYQIGQNESLNSLHIGIQRNSNTLKLFDTAHNLGMKYILADELFFENLSSIYQKIDEFAASVDLLYLTICMDVFNVSIAPGVSAPAYNGIFADATFMHWYRRILKNEKLVALDVAEVNPTYDIGERTARLAASLVNEWWMI